MEQYTYPAHDAAADAATLHKAFKGAGTDEDAVIAILAHRSKAQLEAIDHEYRKQSASGTSLQHALERELSGSFKDLAVALATPPLEYKKRVLKEAVEGLGTRESTIIDVFSQSTNEEIREISKDADLYKKLLDDVSGDFKLTLIATLKAERPSGGISDSDAEKLAGAFYKAGEGKLGTDEKKYIEIIANHSHHALLQIDAAYKEKHKHGLVEAVKSETSGNLEDFLVALLRSRVEHFASRLHGAIAGLGTNERVIVYTWGVLNKHELKEVDKVYTVKYKESLEKAIKSDTSFNFRKLLLETLK